MILASLAALAAVPGCASSRTVSSQAELDTLPRSKGAYGGSYMIQTWSYLGSDDRYDHFRYTYTRGNIPHRLHVRVLSGLVALKFASGRYRLPDNAIPVKADYRDGTVSGFYVDTKHFDVSTPP